MKQRETQQEIDDPDSHSTQAVAGAVFRNNLI